MRDRSGATLGWQIAAKRAPYRADGLGRANVRMRGVAGSESADLDRPTPDNSAPRRTLHQHDIVAAVPLAANAHGLLTAVMQPQRSIRIRPSVTERLRRIVQNWPSHWC